MRFLATMLPLLAVTAEAVNVVSMDIVKHPATGGKLSNRLRKRATVGTNLANNVTFGSYLASVQVGTPPQTMMVGIDTGSSDVWVLSNDTIICDPENQFPGEPNDCAFGTFVNTSSSTFKDINPGGFFIEYADGTEALGDWITDDFTIGNATIKGLQMGLGSGQTSLSVGLMGIGYDTDESTLADGEAGYPNFIDEMVSQKLISTKAYSLYLNSLEDSTGSILFGGIDTAKYEGDLISVPVQPDADGNGTTFTSFTVSLTGFSVTNGSTKSSNSLKSTVPVILDSGTTLSYLPEAVVKPLYTAIGALDETEEIGAVFANCDLNTTETSYNFQFGGANGPTISVTLDELLTPISADELEEFDISPPPFENTCEFGLVGQVKGPYLLGDSFLRSAYVVYDLKNNEIGLAQTKFDSDESNVIEIPSSATAIPLVSGVATGGQVTQTATGIIGGAPGSGASSTGSSPATVITTGNSPSGSGSSNSSLSSVFSVPPLSSVATSVGSSSKSASGTASTASSSSSAATFTSSFDFSGLTVLSISGFFTLIGGLLFVL